MLNTADQTSAADNTTKVDHDIIIALEHGNALPPNPLPELHFGQTVRYRSPSGKVRIVFPGQSPFRTADNQPMREVQDSQIVTLATEGTFTCQCFITPHTPPNAKEVGWDPQHRESGGIHHVARP